MGIPTNGTAIYIDPKYTDGMLIGMGMYNCGAFAGSTTCPTGTENGGQGVTWTMTSTGNVNGVSWQYGFSGCAWLKKSHRTRFGSLTRRLSPSRRHQQRRLCGASSRTRCFLSHTCSFQ